MFLKFRNYLLITTLKGSPNSGSSTTAVATSAGGKRKTSRRANTAERRATHNAVERQRRETLNGRFLDLAALLPNLASVRRPSKSAIVNSSIVQIHQARRTRLLAARELRLIRSEADALRRELNEWRARAGLPRIEEPQRSPEFLNLIAPQDVEGTGAYDLGEMGEEERRAYELVMQDNGEDDGMEEGEEDLARMGPTVAFKSSPSPSAQQQQQQQQQQLQQQLLLAQRAAAAAAVAQQHQLSFARASALGLGFDGMPSHPALSSGIQTMYEPSGHPHGVSHSLPVHPEFASHAHHLSQEKLSGSWNNSSIFMGMNQTGQWTSQGSAHSPGANGNSFFLQQQQGQGQQTGMYASPELDDTSSIGSADGISSNAITAGSTGGSPVPFDQFSHGGRRPSLSISLPTNNWQQTQPLTSAGASGGGRLMNAMMGMM